ncbi:PREDICTED: coiled-coil domain-containing protein 81 [Nanorana parkeri]|uniref:coiled-coil domain-containing protein 81 n=1 Tax=Nanorana parkeri TaxID=125878 RepID=UPI000854A0CB|nr:PREDICTED: coiled-coil domain-containing protein 81 [Nanorana parkeri]
MLDFMQDAGRNVFSTLPKLTEDDVSTIWASVAEFIEHQMSQQKGVQIPGLGTFTLSRHTLDVGNKLILVQRPVFLLSEKFVQIHGLKYNKIFTTSDIPVVPLNFIALSFSCSYNRDTIEGCVRETLCVFSRSVATKQNVEFSFKGIGTLIIRDQKVKMKFYKDFVNSTDGTGSLVKSLSNRPGTADSVMSSGEDPSLRPRSCSALLFPRIEVKASDKPSDMETIPEENVELESGAEPKIEQPIENVNEGEEPITTRRENTPTKRLLNRQCIVPAKVTAISLNEDLERITKPKTAPERLGSSMNFSRPDPEVSQTNILRITTPPPCLDHCRAGQELCYLCLFSLSLQMKSQAIRGQSQKDAAYNMGVAEAIRNERNARNLEFYRSYIFQKRPLTPPAKIKQEQYYQSLTKQVEDRQGKEEKEKQDQELLGKLEQIQLAEGLAAQRAKYFRDKNELMMSYKSALDTQVKMKPSFAPPAEPKITEPGFGRNDMGNDKLAERKRRAQEVSKHQLQTVAERKRLAVLNDLVQQRKESDMLQSTKELLLSDRAAQYEKMQRIYKGLQDDWVKSHEMKRLKEEEEGRFIRAGSHLLLDQFEKYRRCFQCKRRTSNCGETNVWCESRYIPGCRLMV